jgi:integrase
VIDSSSPETLERAHQRIAHLCDEFVADAVEADRRERIRLRDTEAGEFGFERGEVAAMLREWYEEDDVLPAHEAVAVLKKHGVTLTPEAARDLFYAMRPATLRARRVTEEDRDADHLGTPRVKLPTAAGNGATTPAATPAAPSLPLAEVAKRFKKDRVKSGLWGPQTAAATGAHLDRFVKAIGGEREVASISVEELCDWRDGLGLSQGTVRVRCQMVSALFNWCAGRGYIEKNCAAGIAPREPKKKKRAHTSDELRVVFDAGLTATRKKRPDHFWGPLIGVYTGARVSEVCQLAVDDVARKDDFLCFHFREEVEGQRLKTDASRRVVPVHSHLLRLGLEAYLRERKKAGETWLLPHCTPNKKGGKGMGATLSQWWSERKTRLGLSKAVSFHTFRDGVSGALTDADVLETVIIQIIGHENPSMTTGRYGRKLQVKQLAEAIEKLDFSKEVHALHADAEG